MSDTPATPSEPTPVQEETRVEKTEVVEEKTVQPNNSEQTESTE